MHGSHDFFTRVSPYRFETGCLWLLDQRRLPLEEIWIECRRAGETASAIRSLAVRGAPLIGVAAALGLAAAAHHALASEPALLDETVLNGMEILASARPTAVNLPAAMNRMRDVWAASSGLSASKRTAQLEHAALSMAEEDRNACAKIGFHGARFLETLLPDPQADPVHFLTHCNAGALATAGIGTALGIIRAVASSRPVAVFADETRPFFQGARLTAWELLSDGLPVTVLPDVAAASIIASGRVAAAIVGADRIAANGDTANKTGTYPLALVCHHHDVPFLVAAPTTTLDLSLASGAGIPIEMRDGKEVLEIPNPGEAEATRISHPDARALYPAFDVTPATFITAIVTERGVAHPPFRDDLLRFRDEAVSGRTS